MSSFQMAELPHQEDIYEVVMIIINLLSILGCCFNLVLTVSLKISENPLGKMVVALSLMDLIANSISLLMGLNISTELWCHVIGFMQAFGFGGSIFWSCFFAHAYYVMHKKQDNKIINSYLTMYMIISTCLSIGLGIFSVSISFISLDLDEKRCVHDPNLEFFDWKSVIMLVVPSVGSVAFCLGCYLVARSKYKNSESASIKGVLIYPLILAICYFPLALQELYIQITSKSSPFWIDLSVSVLLYSQGFLNAFAYGLSGAISGTCRNTKCFKRSQIKETSLEQSVSVNLVSEIDESHQDIYESDQ